MDTNSGGIAEKWNHYYWESVKRAHKLKILKYPLLCLLTLLFGIAFAVQFCVNGVMLLCHKTRSAFSRRFRYVAILAAVLLLAVAGIFYLQKNSLSTVCIPQNSSSENGTAASETKKSSSQSTASVPAELRLEISKPTLGADGNYQFSVTVKPDETGKSSPAKLILPDLNNSSFHLSGLKLGTNTVTVSGKSPGNLLPASTPKSVIIVDTTSYVMAPNDVYGIRAQLIGQSKDALTAHSSDKQVAGVIKYSSTYYQVIGHKEGSCEIIFEANGMRASTKITVQADTQAHGNAERVLAAR